MDVKDCPERGSAPSIEDQVSRLRDMILASRLGNRSALDDEPAAQGLEMMKAFRRLPTSELRRKAIDLVELLAGTGGDGSS